MSQGALPADLHGALVAVLRERSVRRQKVILASGRESDFYVDARLTTLDPLGAALVGHLILQRLRPEVVAVGGPVTGADPIAGAVAALSWMAGRPVRGFMVRKEAKGHGLKQYIEGRAALADGAPVCVVEDTATTGGSLITAIEKVRESGLVVDRQEGAREALAEIGVQLEALVGREELL